MKAIYNCQADNPDELTFSDGEVIVVDGEEDQEWWVSIELFCCFSEYCTVQLPAPSTFPPCERQFTR